MQWPDKRMTLLALSKLVSVSGHHADKQRRRRKTINDTRTALKNA
jgi:hypothetical protein